jgi:hypothetical protein
VCRRASRVETGAIHAPEEVTMQTTVDRPKHPDHDSDWFAGVVEDVAFITMLFSGIVIIAAIIALAILL